MRVETTFCSLTLFFKGSKTLVCIGQLSSSTTNWKNISLCTLPNMWCHCHCWKRTFFRLLPQSERIALFNTSLNLSSFRGSTTSCKHNSDIAWPYNVELTNELAKKPNTLLTVTFYWCLFHGQIRPSVLGQWFITSTSQNHRALQEWRERLYQAAAAKIKSSPLNNKSCQSDSFITGFVAFIV